MPTNSWLYAFQWSFNPCWQPTLISMPTLYTVIIVIMCINSIILLVKRISFIRWIFLCCHSYRRMRLTTSSNTCIHIYIYGSYDRGGGGGNTISWKNKSFQMLVMNADSCFAFIGKSFLILVMNADSCSPLLGLISVANWWLMPDDWLLQYPPQSYPPQVKHLWFQQK